jgi:hypothetical protein
MKTKNSRRRLFKFSFAKILCMSVLDTNLVCITDYIANAFDNNTQVDVIYTDVSKAFDKLNHNILLSKLNAFGFSPSLLSLLKSYWVPQNSRNNLAVRC